MEFADINKLLDVYRKRLLGAEDDRRKIIEIIARVSGITLNEKELTVRDYVLTVHAGAPIKNELFLYKTRIIEEFSKTLTKKIIDIR